LKKLKKGYGYHTFEGERGGASRWNRLRRPKKENSNDGGIVVALDPRGAIWSR